MSVKDVEHLAGLAKLVLTEQEEKKLAGQLSETIKVVEQLGEVDTKGVEATAQVTGMTNVWREDEIDKTRVLSQEEALSQAKRVANGFFVVKRIIE